LDIKIRTRDAGYCNLKLLLVFLVVYGHLIEPWIAENKILEEIYRLIYMVHMPVFAFLSGLFLKGKENSLRQMKRSFLYYMLLQSAVVLVMKYTKWEAVIWAKPYWHLWYLLSLTYWAGAAYLWNWLVEHIPQIAHWSIKILLIAIAVLAACLAGCIPEINRMYSVSRSIVFFPDVLAGLFCPSDIKWSRYRLMGLAAGIAAAGIYWLYGAEIPHSFLYQAASYGKLGVEQGSNMRLICYLIGSCFGIVLLTWVPQRRFPFSKAGADTMGIYICHAAAVKLIWKMELSAQQILNLAPAMAVMIIWFLFKIFQWNGHIFAIREKKGQGIQMDLKVRG